ncbi:MAG: hypothetical protein OXR84_00170 [Magnetovibrio sp.]|nr:hypothetical protein [Magnetovibrio sp.]
MENLVSRRTFISSVLFATFGLALGACGVKSSPDAPAGSKHPQAYPKPLAPLPAAKKDERTQGAAPTANPGSFYQYPNRPPGQ